MDLQLSAKEKPCVFLNNTSKFNRCFIAPLACLIGLVIASQASAGIAKHVYGRVEYVNINGDNQLIKAKLDTGAKLSSLSATNIKPYQKDGKTWLSFDIFHERKNINFHLDRPLIKYTRIKKRHGEDSNNKYSERPVISLSVCLRHQILEVDVNLIDRANFIYPMLLGSNAISKFEGLVDPAAKFTARPDCYSQPQK